MNATSNAVPPTIQRRKSTTLKFMSSREKDIALGICLGRGYTVTRVASASLPFKMRVNMGLGREQVAAINEQVRTAINGNL